MSETPKCPYCPCRVGQCPGCLVETDAIGGEDYELDEGFGCVLGSRCLMPDPYHFASECHGVEDMEGSL